VWYHALSLGYVCIRSSGTILIPQATFVPNSVSFAASVAELAHGEKSRTKSITQSVTHPAYLMRQELKQIWKSDTLSHCYANYSLAQQALWYCSCCRHTDICRGVRSFLGAIASSDVEGRMRGMKCYNCACAANTMPSQSRTNL